MGNSMAYSSFEEGFRDIYPRLVRTLMVACSDMELSKDIAQESLARTYAHWTKVNQLDIPWAWSRKVAFNMLCDEMRKRSKRKTETSAILDLSAIESIEKSLPTPFAVDLVQALSKLPDQQRIAATLAYVDDCSEKEIAKAMGISQGSVKTHLFHARRSLEHSLEVKDGI